MEIRAYRPERKGGTEFIHVLVLICIFIFISNDYAAGSGPVCITAVSDEQILYGVKSSATIQAWVNCPTDFAQEKVKSAIYPPGASQPSVYLDMLPDLSSEGLHRATWEQFLETGTYRIEIFVSGTDGTLSASVFTSVTHIPEDEFENDDDLAHASVLEINGGIRSHNFHDYADTDWAVFFGLSGITYTFRLSGSGFSFNPYVDLTDENSKLLYHVEPGNDYPSIREISFDWTCPENGIYCIRTKNYDPDIFGQFTAYEFESKQSTGSDYSTIEGLVTGSLNKPIVKARIKTDGGASNLSRENGIYMIKHRIGTFTLIAEADGYLRAEIPVNIEKGGFYLIDIAMYPGYVIPGDINSDTFVNLADAVLALQIAAGITDFSIPIYKEADINSDAHLGLPEAVHSLRKTAGYH